MSKKARYGPPSLYLSVSAAALVEVGIRPVAVAILAICSGCMMELMKPHAPSASLHEVLMPHCQEAPPILGPLPKSTVGRNSASSPTCLTTSSAAQLPVYHRATRPWR